MPGISETRHWLGAKSLRYSVAAGRGAAARGHRQVFAVSPPHHVLVRGSSRFLGECQSAAAVKVNVRFVVPQQPYNTSRSPILSSLPFSSSNNQLPSPPSSRPKGSSNQQPTHAIPPLRPSARNIVVRLFPQSVRLHRSGKFSSPPGPGASPRPPPDRPGQASSPSRIRAACLYGPSKGLPSLQATAHFPVRDPQSSNSPAI